LPRTPRRGATEREAAVCVARALPPKKLSPGSRLRPGSVHRGARAVLRARTGILFRVQLHLPDPSHTGSARSRDNFRLAVKISAGFVVLLWIIQLLNSALDLGPEDFGVRPRELAGLPGILFAPLVHSGFEHLLANSLPLIVLGTAMLYLYPSAARLVLPAVYLGTGIAVWLFARGSSHVGASGLVYGLVAYIFVAGLIRRDRRAIAASLLVCFMYGASVWGLLPIERGVSWETHLAAALIGVALALALRRRDIPPRVRYSWEEENEEKVVKENEEEDGKKDGYVNE
jgi:membrane associated rhomboid family serine protease